MNSKLDGLHLTLKIFKPFNVILNVLWVKSYYLIWAPDGEVDGKLTFMFDINKVKN